MNVAASPELLIDPGVADLLKEHGAESTFQTALELARQYFPDAVAVRVWKLEDPDEDNHTWVVLDLRVPVQDPAQTFRGQIDGFYEALRQRVGFLFHPLSFSLFVNWRE